MKTTMTISIEQDLKDVFYNFSRQIGTNPTNLINMIMKNNVNTKEVRFGERNYLDLEMEEFSENEIRKLSSNKNIAKNTKKLSQLNANFQQMQI